MGFVAAGPKDDDGKQVRGFTVVVGGGTSTMPRAADVVWEFATADDGQYIRVAEACLKVFDKEGGLPQLLRKNMNKARVKFLAPQDRHRGVPQAGRRRARRSRGRGSRWT